MPTYLEDDLLRLRALEPEDLDSLYRWENDSSLWQYGSTLSPISRYNLKNYLTRAISEDIYEMKQVRFVIEEKATKAAVGLIDLYDFDAFHHRSNLGLLVDKSFQRHGYAQRSMKLIVDYAFHFLHLHQLYAFIALDNEACLKLFELLKFTRAGCLSDWNYVGDHYVDVAIYQLISD